MMVNETVADNDSTYIYQTINNTSFEFLDSRFVFGSNGSHAGKFTVNSVTLTVTARTTTRIKTLHILVIGQLAELSNQM